MSTIHLVPTYFDFLDNFSILLNIVSQLPTRSEITEVASTASPLDLLSLGGQSSNPKTSTPFAGLLCTY